MCGARPRSKAVSHSPARSPIRHRIPGRFRIWIHDMSPRRLSDSTVLRGYRGHSLSQARERSPIESLHAKITASGGTPDLRCSPTATWRRPPSFPLRRWAQTPGSSMSLQRRKPCAQSPSSQGTQPERAIVWASVPGEAPRSKRRRGGLSLCHQLPSGGARRTHDLISRCHSEVFPRQI